MTKIWLGALAALAVAYTSLANEDAGDRWVSATFATEEGNTITVRKTPDRLTHISVVFRGRSFVVPDDELRKFPSIRLDSLGIAYSPRKSPPSISLDASLGVNPEDPLRVWHVVFRFDADGKYTSTDTYCISGRRR